MFKHYYLVKCKIFNYYSFLNKINNCNIYLEKIKYNDNYIYFKINEPNLKKLFKYLPSYNFIIIKETGIYYFKNKILKNKEIVICFFIGLILFLIISNLIVDIRVYHEDSEIREIIYEELDNYGVKKLHFKKSFKNMQKIKENILKKYPDKLDWLEFDIDGLIVNVRVEKRIVTKPNVNNKKCHLVAAKDGMISSIKIKEGISLINLYEYVKKGDILISGIITNNEEEVSRVCADGIVFANTWYKVNVNIPFKHIEYKTTNNKKYNIVISNGINKKRILKKRYPIIKSEYKTLLSIFNYKILLEREKEMKKNIFTYKENEALDIGLKKAENSLLKKLNKNSSIIDKKVLKKSINNSTMDIEVFIVVNEQIGTIEVIEDTPIKGDDSNDSRNT